MYTVLQMWSQNTPIFIFHSSCNDLPSDLLYLHFFFVMHALGHPDPSVLQSSALHLNSILLFYSSCQSGQVHIFHLNAICQFFAHSFNPSFSLCSSSCSLHSLHFYLCAISKFSYHTFDHKTLI